MPAAALDQIGNAGAPELADRGVRRDVAATARPFRNLIVRFAGQHRSLQVTHVIRHRRAMRFGVRDERISAVIRHIEPLMSVGDPGIRRSDASEEMTIGRTGIHPGSECAIDMCPRSTPMGDLDHHREWIERTDVQIACVHRHNRRNPWFSSTGGVQSLPWSSAGSVSIAFSPSPRKRTARSIEP